MTDARYPERWLNDARIGSISDAAHRLHVVGLAWSVSNRTDGQIRQKHMRLLPHVNPSHVTELAEEGLWAATEDGWLILDFAATQTASHELQVLENARRRQREKKARQREARSTSKPVTPVSGPGKTQERQGQARRGQEELQPNPKRCTVCNEPLPGPAVAAGWKVHPSCDGDPAGWPETAQIPA